MLNETCTPAERQELAEVLKANAEARQLWFFYCDNECGLAEVRPGGRMRRRSRRRPGFDCLDASLPPADHDGGRAGDRPA